MKRSPRHVAVVLKGYPRLSETFISQELLSLQQLGLEFTIYSLRHPTDKKVHDINRRIKKPVVYLPEYLHLEPLRVLRSWMKARKLPGYAFAMKAFRADLRRDCSRNRFRRFGQGMVLAAEMPDWTDWLYVHFLHTPAAAARYGATMRRLPWSVSAHAKDIYTSPDWDIRDKLAELQWLATCTSANVAHLQALAGKHAEKIRLVYHGLDFSRFPDQAPARPARDGSSSDDPALILSVGRAVPKKGYDILLRALAKLPTDLAWKFIHIGGGSELDRLRQLARELGIEGRISWQGAQDQAAVIAAYGTADLFVLASLIAGDGDRDGLPNVLMEAQSQGLACLSTEVSAIPELIEHGQTGWLVPPGNSDALAQGIEILLRAPAKRHDLGTAGAARVRSTFEHRIAMQQLAELFGLATGGEARDENSLLRSA